MGTVHDLPARIFLVGYRGSGKTTVARHLAERLGWPWLDADEVLERRLGRTVREIFAEEGEPGFRTREAALLEELGTLERHIIATGGGVVLRPENRSRLRTGRVVWLHADADTLWQRISADAGSDARRPNLTVGGRVEVEELLRVRTPLYQQCADVVVDTTGRRPEEIVASILAGLPTPPAVLPC